MSIGVSFSGGGIKAAFHIGVLMALEEKKINIDYISGCSSGAIIAALYGMGFSTESILKFFYCYSNKLVGFDKKSTFKALLNINKGVTSINKFDNLESILKNVFYLKSVFDINDVKKKIAICTVDANQGKIVYFTNTNILKKDDFEEYIDKGALYKIVRASCAYPVIFSPSVYKDKVLVDGGVMNNIPVSILRKMGADKVIAVDVSKKITPIKKLSIVDIGSRCIEIMGKCNNQKELESADFIITSTNIENIDMFEYNKINFLVNEGYKIALNNIKKIT